MGTSTVRVAPLPRVTQSYVLVWSRQNRADNFQQQVALATGINMRLLINEGQLTWNDCSFIVFYTYSKVPPDEEVNLPRRARATPSQRPPPAPPTHHRMAVQ